MSAIKFVLVVGFFMHLKFDHNIMRSLFIGPLILAIVDHPRPHGPVQRLHPAAAPLRWHMQCPGLRGHRPSAPGDSLDRRGTPIPAWSPGWSRWAPLYAGATAPAAPAGPGRVGGAATSVAAYAGALLMLFVP